MHIDAFVVYWIDVPLRRRPRALEMAGNGTAQRPEAARAKVWVRRHVLVYAVVNVALFAVWLGTGGPMWFLFPLVVWGGALAMHRFYVKGVLADDDWAEHRTARLRRNSYDVLHIDQITSAPRGASRLGATSDDETGTSVTGRE
jgi:hypothetical protein